MLGVLRQCRCTCYGPNPRGVELQVVQMYSFDELKVESQHVSDQIVATLQEKVQVAGMLILSMTLNELN